MGDLLRTNPGQAAVMAELLGPLTDREAVSAMQFGDDDQQERGRGGGDGARGRGVRIFIVSLSVACLLYVAAFCPAPEGLPGVTYVDLAGGRAVSPWLQQPGLGGGADMAVQVPGLLAAGERDALMGHDLQAAWAATSNLFQLAGGVHGVPGGRAWCGEKICGKP